VRSFLFSKGEGVGMNRKKQAAISLSAAVLSGVLVYGVYVVQLRQLELQEMTEVVVPKQFIATGTRLEEAHLTTVAMPRTALLPEMLTDVSEAVGLEASMPLGGREPLLRWKIDKYRLLPRAGQSTFQIPREYVKSISSGIRAGDEAVLYLSGEEAEPRRLFTEAVSVAGVKTAANLEIDNPKNSNLLSMANGDREGMYASRRDANGTIDAINLNLTEAQWLELDAACRGGTAKLVIAFQASSIREEARP